MARTYTSTIVICVLVYTFFPTGSITDSDIQNTPTVEIIYETTLLGEGPHWDYNRQQLYFVDIFGKSVNRYDPNTRKTTSVSLDDASAFAIPVQGEDDKFVITSGVRLAVMTWDGNSAKPTSVEDLTTVGDPSDGSRISDGKVDALGRLWSGKMGRRIGSIIEYEPRAGVLFSRASRESARIHAVGITMPNGIAWSLDNKKMYFVDLGPRVIYVFDYDLGRGIISNPGILFDFGANRVRGHPDGITVDAEGKLWVACFGGGQVIRVDPSTGQLLRTVRIPSIEVTSVAFGGANLDELFVTSGNTDLTPDMLVGFPYPGRIFRVTGLGVRGLPARGVVL